MKKKLGYHILWKSLLLFMLTVLMTCSSSQSLTYKSDDLVIQSLSTKTFIHKSFLDIPDFGKFPCNGLIFVNKKEAIVFDTPLDAVTSEKVIQWVQEALGAKIKAVVVNHFHEDCLAGLATFHAAGIPSYASELTIQLAKQNSVVLPQNGFKDVLELSIGGRKVINTFFGPAHTKDNIVSWIPDEKTLFGGCMVKSLGATKGNTADADLEQWPVTIKRIKEQYPTARIIIPGHGDYGDSVLLDYTIQLFSNNE
jgi:metallo-beta-lactamase class B